MCEQHYHGAVLCALGWACWKTYVGRPEADQARRTAMNVLAGGLLGEDHHEDALSIQEAELAMERRLGASEYNILVMQGNLAMTYARLGRVEQALQIERDIYRGRLKLNGEEHEDTLTAANNYANSLVYLRRFEEAKALLRKMIPVARRVLGECNQTTLMTRWNYAGAICNDTAATLDDLREAVTTLEDAGRIARRVFGGAHPFAAAIEGALRDAREALAARET